jgi:putative addiction module component (TIGR02574 family)
MHGMKEIIAEAESLPVEERVMIIDSLLRTINGASAEIDSAWAEAARHRLAELRSGTVKAVPGNEVFARVQSRFGK